MFSAPAISQETIVKARPVESILVSSSNPLTIDTLGVPATSTIPVRCMDKCYLKISLSALFSNITDNGLIAGIVFIDGSEKPVLTSDPVGIDSSSTTPSSQSRGSTWFTQLLKAGRHTIDVGLYMTQGTSGSFSRSVTVDVLEPTTRN